MTQHDDGTPCLLTAAEKAVIKDLGVVWGKICGIVGRGPTRNPDLAEAAAHIHDLQHFVMAQAAARAYPEEFRLLGAVIERTES
jgi:hypothetical protein